MICKGLRGRCTAMVAQCVLCLVHVQMAPGIACTPLWCAQRLDTLSPTQHMKSLGHLGVHRYPHLVWGLCVH